MLGGQMPEDPGAFYPATVLTDVVADMPVFRDATFGPVAPIIIYDDGENAERTANDNVYGLAGTIWSDDVCAAAALAGRIDTGAVFIKGVASSDPRVPIGDVKQSGFGRELSHFGIRNSAMRSSPGRDLEPAPPVLRQVSEAHASHLKRITSTWPGINHVVTPRSALCRDRLETCTL